MDNVETAAGHDEPHVIAPLPKPLPWSKDSRSTRAEGGIGLEPTDDHRQHPLTVVRYTVPPEHPVDMIGHEREGADGDPGAEGRDGPPRRFYRTTDAGRYQRGVVQLSEEW